MQVVADRLAVVELEVFDVTPMSVRGGCGNRAVEIADWLEAAHDRGLKVARWVVLDDRDVRALDERLFDGHTVVVNPFTGFRHVDFIEALRVMGADESDLAVLRMRTPSVEDMAALQEVGYALVSGSWQDGVADDSESTTETQ